MSGSYGTRAGTSFAVCELKVSDSTKEIADDYSQSFQQFFEAPESDQLKDASESDQLKDAPKSDQLKDAQECDPLKLAPEPYRLCFKDPKPFDIEKYSVPKHFPSTGYILEYFSDDELDVNDTISFLKIRAGKAPRKVCSGATKKNFLPAMKYRRQTKRGLSPVRARMQEKETLRGGWFQSASIEHGSFGPCGFEL